MSAQAIVWWATVIALVAVLALAGVQAARALRELNRVKTRVAAFNDLPVMKALGNVEADVQRIEGAAGTVAPLLDRVQTALAVIRKGPIAPELIAAAQRLRTEIVALRRLAAR
ncbi:MAG: hypothetical protein QOF71_3266 [Candidatus Eremiobacteraeota bacterium]|nr:hypothetical protein [Candidatus Eremiobacteraeota bacterium]